MEIISRAFKNLGTYFYHKITVLLNRIFQCYLSDLFIKKKCYSMLGEK